MTINAEEIDLGPRWSNAFIVFDYQSPTDFKFAGAFVGVDRWAIGHSADNANGYNNDASFRRRTNRCEHGLSHPAQHCSRVGPTPKSSWRCTTALPGRKRPDTRITSRCLQVAWACSPCEGSPGSTTLLIQTRAAWWRRGAGTRWKPNASPVAKDDRATTDEDTPVKIDVLSNAADADNDPLAVTTFSDGAHGVVRRGLDKSLIYHPEKDFHGTDSFSYTISDGRGGFDSGTVHVEINAVNDPPVATDDEMSTERVTPSAVDVVLNDTDLENNAIVVTGYTQGRTARWTCPAATGGRCGTRPTRHL